MIVHKLKVHPQFWPAVEDGTRPFELRRNDRNYKVGDRCDFKQYDPKIGFIGDEWLPKYITYILYPEDCPGLQAGYVVFGVAI